jgi:hypothetical protein
MTQTPMLIPAADLDTVNAAITVLCEYPAQDRGLVCDMASAMLSDLTRYGTLGPLDNYVRVYCDVQEAFNGADDAGPIVARILGGTAAAPAPGGPV